MSRRRILDQPRNASGRVIRAQAAPNTFLLRRKLEAAGHDVDGLDEMAVVELAAEVFKRQPGLGGKGRI